MDSLEKSHQDHVLSIARISALENLSFGMSGSFTVEHYDDLSSRITALQNPAVWEYEHAALSERI